MNNDTSKKLGTLVSDDGPVNVYVWDMDETLILLRSLLNGTYAESFNGSKDVKRGVEIGRMWEKHILKICDDFFFYEQVEECNEPFLESLRQYDDGKDLSRYEFKQDDFSTPTDDLNKRKLAYRHRAVAERYEKGLCQFIDSESMSGLDELYNVTDEYTDRWLSSARAFLEQCSCVEESSDGTSAIEQSSQDIHILVTSGALIPSLVKCLLFRLDTFLRHENVYSSIDVGKLQCFKWIKERFNHPKFRFCAIGDGWEECAAAQALQWPFVKIDLQPDSSHRFPGLTPKTVSYYFAAVYGNSDADSSKE
nr:similar to eyes absent protein [Arabidopsis thaliana]